MRKSILMKQGHKDQNCFLISNLTHHSVAGCYLSFNTSNSCLTFTFEKHTKSVKTCIFTKKSKYLISFWSFLLFNLIKEFKSHTIFICYQYFKLFFYLILIEWWLLHNIVLVFTHQYESPYVCMCPLHPKRKKDYLAFSFKILFFNCLFSPQNLEVSRNIFFKKYLYFKWKAWGHFLFNKYWAQFMLDAGYTKINTIPALEQHIGKGNG